MLRFGKYVRAANVQEAYELLQKNRRARVLGGGCWLRLSSGSYPMVIDLENCGLDSIEVVGGDLEEGRALRIGAYVTLRELEKSAEIAAVTDGIFKEALAGIVGVQFRNSAMLGGSVAGRFGFSDICCALLALGAKVELVGAGLMPLERFLAMPGRMRDVLTHVVIPAAPVTASYQVMRNSRTDLPVANACAVRTAGGAWRVAVGARPGRARLVAGPGELGLSGTPTSDELSLLDDAVAALPYSSNMWASERYRRHCACALVRRAVEQTSFEGEGGVR